MNVRFKMCACVSVCVYMYVCSVCMYVCVRVCVLVCVCARACVYSVLFVSCFVFRDRVSYVALAVLEISIDQIGLDLRDLLLSASPITDWCIYVCFGCVCVCVCMHICLHPIARRQPSEVVFLFLQDRS